MLTVASRNEGGSMPMALLASIVVIGIVTVLFGTTLTSERTARQDRDFTASFQGADAAVQAALAHVREVDDDNSHAIGAVLHGSSGDGDDTTGTGTYEWTAEKDVRAWKVWATGDQGELTRHVEAEVEREPLFFLAAFGKTLVGFKGGNGAASYNGTAANTGNGAVGTNGQVELIGSSYADMRFQFGPSSTCTGTQCSSVPEERQPQPHIPETDFIEEALDEPWCQSSIGPWRASTAGGQLVGGDGPGPNGEYCFSSMNFDTDTEIDNTNGGVIAYVSGDVVSTNQTIVNCPECITRGFDSSVSNDPDATCEDYGEVKCMLEANPPNSSDLLLYSSGGLVSLGNHTHMGAGIYAPSATCRGNPSNAQGFIYGSMVCNDINNNGGWTFWYDERLDEVGGYDWKVRGIREEVGGFSTTPPS